MAAAATPVRDVHEVCTAGPTFNHLSARTTPSPAPNRTRDLALHDHDDHDVVLRVGCLYKSAAEATPLNRQRVLFARVFYNNNIYTYIYNNITIQLPIVHYIVMCTVYFIVYTPPPPS